MIIGVLITSGKVYCSAELVILAPMKIPMPEEKKKEKETRNSVGNSHIWFSLSTSEEDASEDALPAYQGETFPTPDELPLTQICN